MREKAAQEDVLVLHLIRNAIGQTYFVVADCEPARKERINQNRGVTADQSRGTFFGALIVLKERGIGCPKMKFERFDERARRNTHARSWNFKFPTLWRPETVWPEPDFSGNYGTPVTLSPAGQAVPNELGITGIPPKATREGVN